jgi:hypothetical protein
MNRFLVVTLLMVFMVPVFAAQLESFSDHQFKNPMLADASYRYEMLSCDERYSLMYRLRIHKGASEAWNDVLKQVVYTTWGVRSAPQQILVKEVEKNKVGIAFFGANAFFQHVPEEMIQELADYYQQNIDPRELSVLEIETVGGPAQATFFVLLDKKNAEVLFTGSYID